MVFAQFHRTLDLSIRILWLVLTISAFAGAVYCALNQLARYNSEPVVVSLQRDYRGWSTAFPAVTACFLERIDPDKAKEVIARLWNVTEESDGEKYQYYYEFVELIAEISFRGNLQNFWKYQADDSVNNIDLLQLAVQWMTVMTEEGLCQTFNAEYAKYQIVDDAAWRSQELMKCHYHSEACYVQIDTSENGIRYFVHSPFEIATAISNPTGEVLPGEELDTDFKVSTHIIAVQSHDKPVDVSVFDPEGVVEIEASDRIKSLRSEQRRCRYPEEWVGGSIKVVEIEASDRIKSLRSEQRRCRYPEEWVGGSIKVSTLMRHLFCL
ncbi:uncharacterized protein LOC112045795 [Bicyclus anynana]|uniref:Uncharacterized protein LOC112045795 n=1 Tax=Bicyclus anynana TaxID=110368 RepID=A0ABM3M486_BICAN|nr:uncharacterized protein LOC112045795 [Bicyclus anynana]